MISDIKPRFNSIITQLINSDVFNREPTMINNVINDALRFKLLQINISSQTVFI